MSNSPKYSVIELDLARSQAEMEAQRQRAAARRERAAERERQFRRLGEERARRATERERERISARLGEVRALLPRETAGRHRTEVRALAAEIADLDAAKDTATDLAACLRQVESLRARALALAASARDDSGLAGRERIVAGLREQMAALRTDARKLAAQRYERCVDLIGRLEAAAPSQDVRFEALLGTVEHEVGTCVREGTEAALAARAAQEEAEVRLDAIGPPVQGAIGDAVAFEDTELSETLTTAMDRAAAAVRAGRADPALARAALAEVAGLEQLLPDAEARLDERQAAHERRGLFAEALKDVLADQGMSFRGGTDTGSRFLLQFERPGGAVYTAAIDDGGQDDLVLSYSIEGEEDVPVRPDPGWAVCDQTEAFLEAIHAELAGSGYKAGEIQWEGKPPRSERAPRARRAQPSPASLRRQRESR